MEAGWHHPVVRFAPFLIASMWTAAELRPFVALNCAEQPYPCADWRPWSWPGSRRPLAPRTARKPDGTAQVPQLAGPGRCCAAGTGRREITEPSGLISSTARSAVPAKSPQRWTANSQAPSASPAS
jgi:hypothetical protein